MLYLSVSEVAEKWGITRKRIQVLCNQGRIDGAQRVGNVWMIPDNAIKPSDARKKISENTDKSVCAVSIERVWAMPNKNTFDIKPIHDLIVDELTEGLWIDPFANKNKLASVTNDLNKDFDTDYHLDALEFMKLFGNNSVDGVLYDPPYSPRQVSECYNNVGYEVTWDTTKASFWGNHKREISRIVKLGGKVITFGWNSGGIGRKYGFEISRILLVPHGGWHNDTICTVEIKTHNPELPISEKRESSNIMKNSVISLSDTDKRLIDTLSALPKNYWDFKNEDVREFTHGIHNYPAMMVSPISRNILRIVQSIKEINTLLDPFSGSGTVLVEGMLANIPQIYGTDINPLAFFLDKVKTTNLNMDELQEEVQQLYSRIKSIYANYSLQIDGADDVMQNGRGLDLASKDGWGSEAPKYLSKYIKDNFLEIEIPQFKNIGYWFKPKVILLLSVIKAEINNIHNDYIKRFVYAAFSETIRFVSNRRNGEFKMFRMPAEKVRAFEPNVINEFQQILDRNVKKMHEFNEKCAEIDCCSTVKVLNNSATSLNDIPNESIDLVITSPPYGDSRTTVAYGEYSKLSLLWIDEVCALSEKEIAAIDKSLLGGGKYRNGFEYTISSQTLRQSLEKIKEMDIERAGDVFSFYLDLEQAISRISQKTKKDGYQFWVVGNRTVKNEILQTDKIIAEIAQHYDLKYIYTINRNIINKVMPSQNSPTNETGVKSSTMTNEHIVVLRKE